MTVAEIALPRIVRMGAGALDCIGNVVADLGSKRPFVVTDEFMAHQPSMERLLASLVKAGLRPAVFSGTVSDPTEACVATALAAVLNASADCVIGFGGGSPIDTAKAVAVLGARGAGTMRQFMVPHIEDARLADRGRAHHRWDRFRGDTLHHHYGRGNQREDALRGPRLYADRGDP